MTGLILAPFLPKGQVCRVAEVLIDQAKVTSNARRLRCNAGGGQHLARLAAGMLALKPTVQYALDFHGPNPSCHLFL